MVRISQADYIDLLLAERHATLLEAEVAGRRVELARLEATARAHDLIDELSPASSLDNSTLRTEVLGSLPYDADGALHEEALRAVVLDRVLDPRFTSSGARKS